MYTKKGRKSNRSASNKHIKFITKSLPSKKTPSPDNLNDENTKVINTQMFFRKERRTLFISFYEAKYYGSSCVP